MNRKRKYQKLKKIVITVIIAILGLEIIGCGNPSKQPLSGNVQMINKTSQKEIQERLNYVMLLYIG